MLSSLLNIRLLNGFSFNCTPTNAMQAYLTLNYIGNHLCLFQEKKRLQGFLNEMLRGGCLKVQLNMHEDILVGSFHFLSATPSPPPPPPRMTGFTKGGWGEDFPSKKPPNFRGIGSSP